MLTQPFTINYTDGRLWLIMLYYFGSEHNFVSCTRFFFKISGPRCNYYGPQQLVLQFERLKEIICPKKETHSSSKLQVCVIIGLFICLFVVMISVDLWFLHNSTSIQGIEGFYWLPSNISLIF